MTKKKTTKKMSTGKPVVITKEEGVSEETIPLIDGGADLAPSEDEHWREKEAEKLSNKVTELEKKIVQLEIKKKEIQDSLKSIKSQRDLALQNLRELFDPSMKTLWDEKRDREAKARKDTTPIGELDVTPKIINAMTAAGIKTIGELRSFDKPLNDLAGIGDKARRQIEDALKAKDEADREQTEPSLPFVDKARTTITIHKDGMISLPDGFKIHEFDPDNHPEILSDLSDDASFLKTVSILEEQHITTFDGLIRQIIKGRKFVGVRFRDMSDKITIHDVIQLADIVGQQLGYDTFFNFDLHNTLKQFDILRKIEDIDLREKINKKLLKNTPDGHTCLSLLIREELAGIMVETKLTRIEQAALMGAIDEYCDFYHIPESRR